MQKLFTGPTPRKSRISILDQQDYEKWKANRSGFFWFCEIMGGLAVMTMLSIFVYVASFL